MNRIQPAIKTVQIPQTNPSDRITPSQEDSFECRALMEAITSSKKRQPSKNESFKCVADIEKMSFQDGLTHINNQSFSADSYIYVALIKKMPSDLLYSFSQKIPKTKDNIAGINNLLNALGKAHQFKEAKELFETAIEEGMTNSITYNSYITLCGKNDLFEETTNAFQAAVRNKMANEVTYNSYASFCEGINRFKELNEAFELAVQNNLASFTLYNHYITICGKTHHFKEADKAFELAVKTKRADPATYTAYMDICGKTGNFEKAKEIFSLAVEKKMLDAVIYTVYISICIKNNRFQEATEVFNKAVANKLLKTATYDIYIDFCGKTGHFQEADEAFKLAIKNKMAKATTYGCHIDACGRTGHFQEAHETFEMARKNGIVTTAMNNIYMNACAKNGQLKEADELFRTTTIDAFSYSTLIDACGKSGKLQKAEELFELAVRDGMADPVVYNSYINTCRESGQFEEAAKAFATAVRLQKTNHATYHIYIDVHLAHNNNILECKNILKQGKLPFVHKIRNDQIELDLHGFSHGSGVVALASYFEENPDLFQLTVITGKGCLEDGNYLAFRNQLTLYIGKFLPWLEAKSNPTNDGNLFVRRRADSEEYHDKLITLRNNKKFEQASQVFNDAVSNNLATDRIYHTYCDIILLQKGSGESKLPQLTALLHQGNLKPIKTLNAAHQKTLDLTGFSYGSAVGAIAELFLTDPKMDVLRIIPGNGVLDEVDTGFFRAQLGSYISLIPWLECRPDPENEQILYVRRPLVTV